MSTETASESPAYIILNNEKYVYGHDIANKDDSNRIDVLVHARIRCCENPFAADDDPHPYHRAHRTEFSASIVPGRNGTAMLLANDIITIRKTALADVPPELCCADSGYWNVILESDKSIYTEVAICPDRSDDVLYRAVSQVYDGNDECIKGSVAIRLYESSPIELFFIDHKEDIEGGSR